MAIGSQGEYGATFGLWKDMDDDARQAWWEYMRIEWTPLMKGYATLIHKKNNRFYQEYDQ